MMTLYGTVVSAAWPVFLAAIPVGLGALIYLFRAKGTITPQVTSTLFLLSRIQQYAPHRRRFMPPPQFWLECALAIALASAASGVMSIERGARVAVVVDVSKSMGAILSGDETRLGAATRIASADISQAPSDTRFTVWSVGRTLTARTERQGAPSAVGADEALNAVGRLVPTYDVDNLAAHVSELLAQDEYDTVWLYTDRGVEGASRGDRLRVTTIPIDLEAVQNVWISALTLSPAENSRIEVAVSQVGRAQTEVRVGATCTDRVTGETFALPPATQRIDPSGVSLVRLSAPEKPWSYCRVSLEQADGDLLVSDNEAWVVHSSRTEKIGVVSALGTEALGLARNPYGTAVALASEAAMQDHNLQGVIFHRIAPTVQPPIATLVVYPDTGVKLWGALVGGSAVQGTGRAVEITRWDEAHPLLQYVRPNLLTVPTARVLECPRSAQPIVHSASGPIVCAGEEDGTRYVILGFEIFPFDGLKTPTVSIFTLNTLKWLLEGAEANTSATVMTGVVQIPGVRAASPPRVSIVAPVNEPVAVAGSRSVVIATPAVLSITDTAPDVSRDTERFLAVNAIAHQESDLTLQTPVEVTAGVAAGDSAHGELAPGAEQHTRTYSSVSEAMRYETFFAWCAFFILVADLLRRAIRRVGWGERA